MEGDMGSVSEAIKDASEDFRLPLTRSSRLPWAALALAAVVLLPFLGKAYTIDDPVFLREAQNVLRDPLHPSAFRMVWASARNLRASEFLPGGPVAAYLLVPLALAGVKDTRDPHAALRSVAVS